VTENLHLGEFEQLAMLAVLRLDEGAYGASVQEMLEARAGRTASISAIYITLTRLEAKGLVSSRMGAPTDQRGGKARRFFRVESAGRVALEEARTGLRSMWDGLGLGSDRPGSGPDGPTPELRRVSGT